MKIKPLLLILCFAVSAYAESALEIFKYFDKYSQGGDTFQVAFLKDYSKEHKLSMEAIACSLLKQMKYYSLHPQSEYREAETVFFSLFSMIKYKPAYQYINGYLRDATFNVWQSSFLIYALKLEPKYWYRLCDSVITDYSKFIPLSRFELYQSYFPEMMSDSGFYSTKRDSIIQLNVIAMVNEPDPTLIPIIDSMLIKYCNDDYFYSKERIKALSRLESLDIQVRLKTYGANWREYVALHIKKFKAIPPEKLHSSPYFKKLFENAENEILKTKSKSTKKTTSSSKN